MSNFESLESTLLHTITPEQLKSMFDALHSKIEQMDSKQERFFTRDEVSKMFNVDFSTLYNWNKSGVLKSGRLGGKVIYKLSDIEAAIK